MPTIEEEVLPDGQQDVLPPATAAATGGPPLQTTSKSIAKGLSNVVRNLLNPLGSTPRMTSPGSTPRTLTPRITIPLVRPPPGLPSGLPRPAATNQAQISFPAPRQPGPVHSATAGQDALTATVDRLLDFVQSQQASATKEREEERALRNEQLKNQAALSKVLENLASKPEESSSSMKGRVSLVPHLNPEALKLTGCAVGPQFAIQGDPTALDMKEARHKIKSGRNIGITQDARISETWPNQYLCPLMMDGIDPKQFDHDRITLVQWAGGFVGKIFAEFKLSLIHI